MKKYKGFYDKYAPIGYMPKKGLCSIFGEDFKNLFNDTNLGYWGYDGRKIFGIQSKEFGISYKDLTRKFTPLRQNMILLMACINNEL